MLYTSNALNLMAFYFLRLYFYFVYWCFFSSLQVCLSYVYSAHGGLKRPSGLLNWAMWVLGTELRPSKEQLMLLPAAVY